MSSDDDSSRPTISRREVLASSLVAAGALAGCPSDGESTTAPADSPAGTQTTPVPPSKTRVSTTQPTPRTTTDPGTATPEETPTPDGQLRAADVPQAEVRGSHHPGPPRFTAVGEQALGDLLQGNRVDAELSGVDGDLAPQNPVHGEDFTWTVADAPDASGVSLDDTPVVHFEPDEPGVYTLELDAPDDTHELTVRAFPEESPSDPQPRVTLSGSEDGGRYVFEADAQPSPESDRSAADLDVEFYVDDRDKDAFEGELSVDGHTASVPADAVSDTLRVHAVAVGDSHSVADFVRVESDGTISHPNDPPAWIREASIYEIFVRGFGEGVSFEFLEEKLDYIESMGTDVIWLTPVLEAHSHANPFVPGGPHGYDITNYYETADALGPRENYEAFVEAAHDRDMKVIFDMVINHTAREHRYFQAAKNGTDVASEDRPFFHDMYEWRFGNTAHAYFGWSGIPLVNYDSLALRSWILHIVEEWQPVVDGFRCDVAWGVPRSFWKEVRHRIKAEDPEFLLLDETVPWHSDFAEDQFDIHFDYGFFETLREIARGSEPATALHDILDDRAAEGYPEHTTFVNYVENHDEDRYFNLASANAQMAAGAATFTIPGTPMIYYGQETGLRQTRETMNWDSISGVMQSHYKALVDLYDAEPALDDDAAFHPVELDDRPTGVVAYGREADDSQLLVVLNFGSGGDTVAVPDGVETTDLISGEDVSASGGVAVESAVVLRADDATLA